MFILMDAHQRNEGGNNNERSESEESSWSGTTLQDRVNVHRKAFIRYRVMF